jgi:hypothetical protein
VSRSRLSQFHRDCGAPFSHDRSGDGGSRIRRRVSRGSGRSTYRNFIVVPDVCFGSFADMVPVSRHVRFASHSGDSWPGCETSYRDGSPKAGDANQSVRVPQPILDGSSQLPPGTFLNKSSPRNHLYRTACLFIQNGLSGWAFPCQARPTSGLTRDLIDRSFELGAAGSDPIFGCRIIKTPSCGLNEADNRNGASTPSPSERHNSSLLWVTGGLPIGSEKASSRSSIRPLRYSGITRMVAVPGTGPGIGAGDGAAPWTGAGWNAAAGWEGCLTAASCDGAGAGGVASTGGASIAGTSLACAGGSASSTGAGVALGLTGGVAVAVA